MSQSLSPLSSGPLDMHSHLMPGVDDGCQSLQETLACIAQLKAAGFAGSICTPHMISKEYPDDVIGKTVMQLLTSGRYQLLATDLHRPTAFQACRLQGLANARQAVGQEAIGALLVDMPRRILGLAPVA